MVRPVGLTTNFESVRSGLDSVMAVGDTSLRDALFLALQTAAPEATRPLLLIFTDGAALSVNLTRAKGDIVARPGYWVSSR